MAIMVTCTCGAVMSVADEFAGQAITCSTCQRVVGVPAVGPVAAAAGPAPAGYEPHQAVNAGYAAAPAPGYGQPPPGYGQPPPGYGQPAGSRGKQPGRGLLITGGVLSILAFLSCISLSALFTVAADRGKLDTIPAGAYALLAFCALAGIVFASLSFASMAWAALTSGILQAVFIIVFAITAPEISDPSVTESVQGVTGFIVLSAVFTFLGWRQAVKYRKWKGA